MVGIRLLLRAVAVWLRDRNVIGGAMFLNWK